MKTIFKYPFEITGLFELKLPAGAKILTAFIQNGQPCLWAEVDTEKQLQTERFAVIGTGNPIPDNIRDKQHIATFPDRWFIWHLFKVVLK